MHPLLFTLLLLTSFPLISCKYVDSSLYKSSSWTYLDKFCFDEHGGVLTITVNEDTLAGYHSISFYADMESQWFSVYGGDQSCHEKVAIAARTYLLSEYGWGQGKPLTLLVAGSRPRWWYMALSNCDGPRINGTSQGEGTINIPSYTLHMTNEGGKWSYEFSKDEQGITEMSIFFFCLDIVLILFLIWAKRVAKQRGMNYHVMKFLGISVVLRCIGMICLMIHGGDYANDGQGHPAAQHAQFFFEFVCILFLLLIVLDMAKGWPVSTNYVPSRRVTFCILGLYFLAYFILFIYQQKGVDPASTVYLYQSPPGFALITFRFLTFLYYAINVIRTYRLETDTIKKNFYIVFSIFATVWLLAMPFIALIAMSAIPSWSRAKLVFGMVQTTQTIAYWTLFVFFMPWRSNKFSLILNPQETRAFGNNNMQIFPAVTLSTI